MPISGNVKAAGFMVLGMSAFTINDVIVKTLLDEISIGQAMSIRGGMVVLMLYLMMRFSQKRLTLQEAKNWPVMLRGFFEAGASIFFMLALANMPIANISAILQALPLAVTLGAMVYLKEPVGWRRMSAIIAGFLGVMIIIRPGSDGFTVYSLFMVICVFFAMARDLATRKMSKDTTTLFASLVTAAFVMVTGIALLPFSGGWQPVSLDILLKLGAAALFLLGGYQFLINALRGGDISVVAPFRYSALLWAILLGYLVFDNLPDFWTIIGSCIVVGSGLYALLRERQRNRRLITAKQTSAITPPARGT